MTSATTIGGVTAKSEYGACGTSRAGRRSDPAPFAISGARLADYIPNDVAQGCPHPPGHGRNVGAARATPGGPSFWEQKFQIALRPFLAPWALFALCPLSEINDGRCLRARFARLLGLSPAATQSRIGPESAKAQ